MSEVTESDLVLLMDGHEPPEGEDAQREYFRVAALRIAEAYPEAWRRRLLAGSIPYSLHEFNLRQDRKRYERSE